MKRTTLLILMIFLAFGIPAEAKTLKALFSYCTFNAPGSGPFVETYLSVLGSSAILKRNEAGNLQGSIEVTLKILKEEEVVHLDKYNLLSNEISDGESKAFNFIDQQRIPLKNGNYLIEISIKDNYNDEASSFKVSQPIAVSFYSHIIALSDIQLLDSYTKADNSSRIAKSGMDLVPYVSNYYPEELDKLKFYAEVYHADKHLGAGEKYLLTYYIESFENKRILENFKVFKREEAKDVSVILAEFPIDQLPSGNYNLVVELRDRKNELLVLKQQFFQRSNDLVAESTGDYRDVNVANTFAAGFTDRDSLADHIKSLRPISNETEKIFEDNQVKLADLTMMQQFFYDFWLRRNSQNPESEWNKYYEQVKIVNENFGTRYERGYDTERGRVYLQYGQPNSIQQSYNEPSAYPYEIWHYYKIGNFTNKRFVFFNPNLASEDFRLLHSDMQGEVFNARWELELHNRSTQSRDFDDTRKDDNFGNRSTEQFRNP